MAKSQGLCSMGGMHICREPAGLRIGLRQAFVGFCVVAWQVRPAASSKSCSSRRWRSAQSRRRHPQPVRPRESPNVHNWSAGQGGCLGLPTFAIFDLNHPYHPQPSPARPSVPAMIWVFSSMTDNSFLATVFCD